MQALTVTEWAIAEKTDILIVGRHFRTGLVEKFLLMNLVVIFAWTHWGLRAASHTFPLLV